MGRCNPRSSGDLVVRAADGIAEGTLRAVDVERASSAVYGAVILAGLHEIVVHGALTPDDVLRDVETVVLDGLARHGDGR